MPLNAITVQNVAITYICLWATAPVLGYGTKYRILASVAFATWVAIEAFQPRSILERPTVPVLMALVYVGYTAYTEMLLDGTEGVIRQLQIWIMLYFLVVYESRRHDLKSLIPVFWVVLATMPIWQIITIEAVMGENRGVARLVSRSSEEAEGLMTQGIGGFGLVYASLMMLPGLIGIAKSGLRLKNTYQPWPMNRLPSWLASALILLNIGLAVALVATAGYSIAIIGLLVIILAATILNQYSRARLFFTIMLAFAIVTFAKPVLIATLSGFLPFAEGTPYVLKINDLLDSLEIGDSVGTVELRTERYWRSLLAFLENPVIGVLEFDRVGKHSSILDNYGRWGIAFGSIFVYLIAYLPLRSIRLPRSDMGTSVVMLLLIVLFSALNPNFMGTGVMLYILFPVACYLIASMKRTAA